VITVLATASFVLAFWLACVIVTVMELAKGAQSEWRVLDEKLEKRAQMIGPMCDELRIYFRHDPVICKLSTSLSNRPKTNEPELRRMRAAVDAGDTIHQIYERMGEYSTLFHSPALVAMRPVLYDLDETIAVSMHRYNTLAASFNARRHDFVASLVTRCWSREDLPTLGLPVPVETIESWQESAAAAG
jgi:hypothetical protein